MFVFVQGAAESVASSDVEVRDLAWIGEWRGSGRDGDGVRTVSAAPLAYTVTAMRFSQAWRVSPGVW